ncbi:ubiquitin-conjugating enzyme, partial [Conidiobolus coronatus NRRL 28638]
MATKFNIKRVVKELKDLELDPPAGIICYSKDDSLKDLEARIKGPPDTPYSEGEFKLKITLPNNYPLSPPSIIFETPIYHPNIDESGVICLDILKKGNSGKWTPVQTLSTVLISLTVLLSEPNPDDPLRKEVADIFRRNPIQFRKLA